jgi:ubiquinone/menaquinone biosynthesis C-methylase UbiE
MSCFKDLFSNHAQDYAQYRPLYPVELFEYLATLTAEHHAVWDCATGNGQVAIALTPYFQTVYATDASQQQIDHAFLHPQVQYQVALAERSPLADHSIDLITVGQAVHWFKFEEFYREVRRVGKVGGAIALFSYGGLAPISDRIDAALQAFMTQVQPLWSPEIEYVLQEYRTIPFPFVEIAGAPMRMSADWTVEQLLGFLKSWSATQRYLAKRGDRSLDQWVQAIATAWGNPEQIRQLEWKLFMRIGRL